MTTNFTAGETKEEREETINLFKDRLGYTHDKESPNKERDDEECSFSLF